MQAWWQSQGEGNSKASVLTELPFNQRPQMQKHGKSALAIPEIEQVTRRMAGDSLIVLSHHRG